MDDIPVGGGSNNQFMDEQPPQAKKEDADADKPLEERLLSKAWATRAEAYKQLGDKYKQAKPNSDDDLFREHSDKWQKYLADMNPGALEKSLDCFQAYLDKVKPELLAEHQISCFKPLIEKCLGAPKAQIKAKGLECFLMIFEVSENFEEESIDALVAYCKHKVIKNLTSSVGLLANLIAAFGIKKIPVAKFAPVILNAANSSNPAARTEAMNCYKSLYLYLGDGVDTFTDQLKQQQKDALKKDYEELKGKPNERKRLTRSEKEKQKEAALDALIEEEAKEEEKVDVYDLAAPKDILKQFNQAWIDEVAAMKKWNEKKDKLEELTKEADVPKLEAGDYTGLAAQLGKMIKETNVNVSLHAIKAFGALAKGLRLQFGSLAKEQILLLFQKFKERRLVEDINITLEHVLLCLENGVAEILEQVQAGLKERAPATKQNIAAFLEKTVLVTYIDPLEDIKDEFLPIAFAITEEKDANVRDQGLKLMGALQGRLGEQAVSNYVEKLNPQKKAKVEESAKEVKPSKYDKSARKAAAAEAAKRKAEAAAKKKAAAAPPKKKPVAMTFDDKEETKAAGGGDEEMMDFMAPPKKAPPKRVPGKPPTLGQKPEKKGPPTLSSAAPKSTAKSSGKGPSAPQIVEEDLGSGLSKEEAIDKVNEFYASAHTSQFKETAWKAKVAGLQGIIGQIDELKPDAVMLEATAKFVKANMKDWKESNINLMKEAINCLAAFTKCDRVPKRAVHTYSQFLCDKIGDIKLNKMIKEVIMDLADYVTPKFIANFLIKNGSSTKAVKNIEETCNILGLMVDEFGAGMMPVKECIDFATLAANNANVKVRNASMSLFAMLYKHLGETVRNFLTDIKDSTMKLIEAEFAKVTPLQKGEFVSKREVKGDAAEEMAAGGGNAAASLEDSLPREDISKKLGTKLMALFKDKDWKKRKEGATKVEEILREAKMRIKPDGINELMDNLKNGMKDPNKAVVKCFIALLGLMAEALGEAASKYTKKCLVPCIQNNLSDKQSLVRNDVCATMDKWAAAIGPSKVIAYLVSSFSIDNPELRTDGFNWLKDKEKFFKDCDHSIMIKPLVQCLSDKKSAIRVAAEENIVLVMKETGFQPFVEAITDLKPAVKNAVRPILEKAKAKVGVTADVEMKEEKPKVAEKKAEPASMPKPKAGAVKIGLSRKPPTEQPVEVQEAEPEVVEQVKPVVSKQPVVNKQPEAPKQPIVRAQPQLPETTSKKKATTSKATPAAKAKEPTIPEDFTCNPGNKEKRFTVDMKTKWMHEELQKNQVDKVRKICEDMFGFEFMKNKMFHNDFKKHCQVIDIFTAMITDQPQNVMETIDVIFKWCYIRLSESSNTTLAVKVFDFFDALFDFLSSNDYMLWDHEAYVVIPLLCDKAGLTNVTLKQKVKALIKVCFEIYDTKKCLQLVIKFGAGSKNLKSVAEGLDEISYFIKSNGLDLLTEKDLKFIAKLADSGDKGVREGALTVLAEAYKVLDEDIWRVVGNVTVKVKGLLEQRFKKIKGLGSSSSTTNLGIPQTTRASIGQPSPMSKHRPTTAGSGLQRSLVGGQNKAITPRQTVGFQSRGGLTNKLNTSGTANNLNRSIGGGNKFQNDLNRSIGGGNKFQNNIQQSTSPQIGMGQRPQTAQISNTRDSYTSGSNQRSSIGQFGMKSSQVKQFKEPEQDDSLRTRQTMQFHPAQDHDLHDQQQEEVRKSMQHTGQQHMFADDDEDLREQIDQLEIKEAKPQEEPIDPETKAQMDTIMKHIQSLKYGDLSKRVDSLVAINEIISQISQYQKGISKCANDMANAFTHVLTDVFERHLQEIPLRFAKYFVTIVNKACTCKEIMQEVDYNHVHDLAEQLLTRLLIDNLDKIGDNREGDMILKNLNASMLRMLENCDPTSIFCVLFSLLTKYKDYTVLPKLPGLIIKCLLKLSKILEKIVEQLKIEKVLLVIHEYLVTIDHEKKTSNDEMGIRIVKTVVNEIVKVERDNIWEHYKVVECHNKKDSDISRWITIILRSFGNTDTSATQKQPQDKPQMGVGNQSALDQEIKSIIDELRSTDQFEGAIPKLHQFLQRNQSLKLDDYLKDLSAHFANFIRTHLETYQKTLAETGSTPTDSHPKPQQNNWTAQSKTMQQSFQKPSVMQEQPQEQTPSSVKTEPQQPPSTTTNRFIMRKAEAQQRQSAAPTLGKPAASGLRFPQTSRNMPTNSTGGSTGGLQQNQNTNDRINQYQNKLSSYRERFQAARKNQPGGGAPVAATPSAASGPRKFGAGTQGSAQKQNLNTSFSAMNTSITQKWNLMKGNKEGQSAQQQMSSTMIGGGGRSTVAITGSQNTLNKSTGPAQDGASHNDLNEKLIALKAKFQNLKKS